MKRFLLALVLTLICVGGAYAQKTRKHIVQSGENVYRIAKQYNISTEQLYTLNPGAREKIVVGQTLLIPDAQNGKKTPSSRKDTYHSVEKGETLTLIAKTYGVTMEDLRRANPNLKSDDSIHVGMVLKIPPVSRNYSASDEFQTVEPSRERRLKNYTVQSGQTIYNLLAITRWTEEELYRFNPALKKGLIAGQVILIPDDSTPHLPSQSGESDSKPGTSVSPTLWGVTNMVLALPFKEDVSRRYVEFYEGLLLALKHEKDRGRNVELYVVDCSDSELESSLSTLRETRRVDVVIGGVSETSISQLSEFAKEKNAKYVLPFASKISNGIGENGTLFQINPPHDSTYKLVASKFVQKYRSTPVVIFNSGKSTVDERKDAFLSALTAEMTRNQVRHFYLNTEEPLSPERLTEIAVSKGGQIVVVPTAATKAVAQELLEAIAKIQNEDITIEVFGYPDWQMYEASLRPLFRRLPVSYYSMFYVDQNSPEYRHLTREYFTWFGRNMSNVYPRYGLLGYDITRYFIAHGKSSGEEDLLGYKTFPQLRGVQSNLGFSNQNENRSQYINNGVLFVTYRDGELFVE
ncbi:MAG: LysM peptidoglycan-binding domain-containing protein [Porphyromonas sp.]|nr:LysM peptidoglycan-binding domain-containing protein [Porphyromonas sp.]